MLSLRSMKLKSISAQFNGSRFSWQIIDWPFKQRPEIVEEGVRKVTQRLYWFSGVSVFLPCVLTEWMLKWPQLGPSTATHFHAFDHEEPFTWGNTYLSLYLCWKATTFHFILSKHLLSSYCANSKIKSTHCFYLIEFNCIDSILTD